MCSPAAGQVEVVWERSSGRYVALLDGGQGWAQGFGETAEEALAELALRLAESPPACLRCTGIRSAAAIRGWLAGRVSTPILAGEHLVLR